MSPKPGHWAFIGLALIFCLIIMSIVSVFLYWSITSAQASKINQYRVTFDNAVNEYDQANNSYSTDLFFRSDDPALISNWAMNQQKYNTDLKMKANKVEEAGIKYTTYLQSDSLYDHRIEVEKVNSIIDQEKKWVEYRTEYVSNCEKVINAWQKTYDSYWNASDIAVNCIVELSDIDPDDGHYQDHCDACKEPMKVYKSSIETQNAEAERLLPYLTDNRSRNDLDSYLKDCSKLYEKLNDTLNKCITDLPNLSIKSASKKIMCNFTDNFTVSNTGTIRKTKVEYTAWLWDKTQNESVAETEPIMGILILENQKVSGSVTFTFDGDKYNPKDLCVYYEFNFRC